MSLDFKASFTPIKRLDYESWKAVSQLRAGNFKVLLKGSEVRRVVKEFVEEEQIDLAIGVRVHLLTLQVKLEDALTRVPIELWSAGELSIEKYRHVQATLNDSVSAVLWVVSILDRSSLDSVKASLPEVPYVVLLVDLERAQEADFFVEELPDVEVFTEPRQALLHLVGRLINE